MLSYTELGLASLLRGIMLGLRLLFTVLALLAFKGTQYNSYSEYVALISFLVVISGAELYNYNQKSSRDLKEYEEHRATYYVLEFFIILVVSFISWSFYDLNIFLVTFLLSELFLMELIRHENFVGRFKFAQLYNLIFRGLTPIVVVSIAYLIKLNVEFYFFILGIINFLSVYILLGIKFEGVKFGIINYKNLVLQVIPLLMYVGFYRLCDLILREHINNLNISEVDKNYVHLAITVLFILEGFGEQILLQPLRNKLLKAPSYRFPKNLFLSIVIVFILFGVYEYNSFLKLVQVMSIYVAFRLINSLYVLLYMRFDPKKFFLFTIIEAVLFVCVIAYEIWSILLFYLLIKTLLVDKILVYDDE